MSHSADEAESALPEAVAFSGGFAPAVRSADDGVFRVRQQADRAFQLEVEVARVEEPYGPRPGAEAEIVRRLAARVDVAQHGPQGGGGARRMGPGPGLEPDAGDGVAAGVGPGLEGLRDAVELQDLVAALGEILDDGLILSLRRARQGEQGGGERERPAAQDGRSPPHREGVHARPRTAGGGLPTICKVSFDARGYGRCVGCAHRVCAPGVRTGCAHRVCAPGVRTGCAHRVWFLRHAAWACLVKAGLKTVWFSSIAQATPSRRSATPRSARAWP